MPRYSLNTAYACLDCAQARKVLEDAWPDRDKFRQTATDCFFDGSMAAAEAASVFVRSIANSESSAVFLSELTKPLPTAIPDSNASALAQVCVFLAITHDAEECRAPLNAFCFADGPARKIAIRTTIAVIENTAHSDPSTLEMILRRTEGFFSQVLRGAYDVQDQYIAIRGLVQIASLQTKRYRDVAVNFIFKIAAQATGSRDGPAAEDNHLEFEAFLTTELAALASDDEFFAKVLLRCLIKSMEHLNLLPLQGLWRAHNTRMLRVVPQVGYELFLFIVMTVAGASACEGNLNSMENALLIVTSVLSGPGFRAAKINEFVSGYICAFGVSIISLCASCGADSQAQNAAKILKMMAERTATNAASCLSANQKDMLWTACTCAGDWNCSRAALCLGSLLKVYDLWDDPAKLCQWFREDFTRLTRNNLFDDAQGAEDVHLSGDTHGAFRDVLLDSRRKNSGGNQPVLSVGVPDHLVTAVCMVAFTAAGLAHKHSRVRFATATAVSSMSSSRALLFFLPAFINRLQEEKNGVVSAHMMKQIMLPPALLTQAETNVVVLRALLQLVHCPRGKDLQSPYNLGLVAVADAARIAPGPATSLLLNEVERLKDRFGFISPQTKAAASAAILSLSCFRPARGTNFVPFVSLCIGREALDAAPEAAALCFETMYIMAENGVLDSAKAAKIVMKSFPMALDVNSAARKSYLRLLGTASMHSRTKKGAVVAEKVIIMLRGCLVEQFPKGNNTLRSKSVGTLTWEQVFQAADSLAQFESSEILRIEYAKEEPLVDTDQERERLEKIEEHCYTLTKDFLNTAELAAQARGTQSAEIKRLLDNITESEWKNRQRSSFDPDRISALRATSEALRRTRLASKDPSHEQASSSGHSESSPEAATDQFARAVRGLPTGVVKALCERCACVERPALKGSDDSEETTARSIAMGALTNAGALSPALPWVALSEDILRSATSTKEEKASALAVVCRLNDKSYEASQSRAKWFGEASPLLLGSGGFSREEVREMFIGMMVHFHSDITKILTQYSHSIPTDMVVVLVDAMAEMDATSPGFLNGGAGLLPIICSDRVQNADAQISAVLESTFATACLSRLPSPTVQALLLDALSPTPTSSDPPLLRLICSSGLYEPLCAATTRVLRTPPSTPHYTAMIHTLGGALAQLPLTQRRSIMYDICSASHSKARLFLAAYCLGTEALLPNAHVALAAAEAVCAPRERENVRRAVAKVVEGEGEVEVEGEGDKEVA